MTQPKRSAIVKPLPCNTVAPFEPVVAAGMKALQAGTATAHQQVEVFNWLLKKAAGIAESTFHPGDPQATAHAEGRRFVGVQMMILIEQKEA